MPVWISATVFVRLQSQPEPAAVAEGDRDAAVVADDVEDRAADDIANPRPAYSSPNCTDAPWAVDDRLLTQSTVRADRSSGVRLRLSVRRKARTRSLPDSTTVKSPTPKTGCSLRAASTLRNQCRNEPVVPWRIRR